MIEVACGIMYNSNNKILMGLRKDKDVWEFPGGKREKNESITECLKREWMEELNLKIIIRHELTSYIDNNYLCRFFIGSIIDESNIQILVHDKICFIDKKELFNLDLFESDYKLINLL